MNKSILLSTWRHWEQVKHLCHRLREKTVEMGGVVLYSMYVFPSWDWVGSELDSRRFTRDQFAIQGWRYHIEICSLRETFGVGTAWSRRGLQSALQVTWMVFLKLMLSSKYFYYFFRWCEHSYEIYIEFDVTFTISQGVPKFVCVLRHVSYIFHSWQTHQFHEEFTV